MAIRVGRWDCQRCGHMRNLGPHTHCSQCGSPRPSNVKFYLPSDAQVVQDEVEIAAAKQGANWVCAFCSNSNLVVYKACTSCGASHEDSDEELESRTYELDAVPRSAAAPTSAVETVKKKGRQVWKYITSAIIGIASFFGLGQISTGIEVTVTAIEWQRSIVVEVYKLVSEEGWSIPQGGQQTKAFQAIHHYDQRLLRYETRTRTVQKQVGTETYVCGQRDLGNGYFEDKYCDRPIYESFEETYQEPIYEQIPVYRTKYQYDIYRWKPFNTFTEKGNDKRPKDPTLPTEVKNNSNTYRVKEKTEAYFFQIEDHKGKFRWYNSDFQYWNDVITLRSKLKAKKSFLYGFFMGLENSANITEVSQPS